jgi:hypothetical protein
MLGHAVPSAEAARKFLYQFHDEEKIEQATAGVGAGAGQLYPGTERALVGFGAGEPRGREGIGPALRGAEDCHRRSGRDGDRTLEAKFTYAAVASGKGGFDRSCA